jgi:hypothetical protein
MYPHGIINTEPLARDKKCETQEEQGHSFCLYQCLHEFPISPPALARKTFLQSSKGQYVNKFSATDNRILKHCSVNCHSIGGKKLSCLSFQQNSRNQPVYDFLAMVILKSCSAIFLFLFWQFKSYN